MILVIMTVLITSIHEVEYEAEFVRGVEGVRHADDEGAIWRTRKY